MLSSSTAFRHFDDGVKVVKLIISLAEKSPTLSSRGTAFYALGLLAEVMEAREVIEECNWEANEGPSYV
jgi:hypothetical protein